MLLIVAYKPSQLLDAEGELEVRAIWPTQERFTLKQYWVTFVCLITIALWCVATKIDSIFGDMGIIAILPIVAFFSTGVLRKVCRPLLFLFDFLSDFFLR